MTTHEALRILSLHAPISRETLNQVYEAALRDAEDDSIHPIYQAYSHLFDLADDAFPFQPEAVPGMIWQQQRPGVPSAATPRPRHMQPLPQHEESQHEQPQDVPQPLHAQQPPAPPLQPHRQHSTPPHSQPQTYRQPPLITTLAADPMHLEDGPAPFFYRIAAGVIDCLVIAVASVACGFNQAFLEVSSAPGAENTSSQLHLLQAILFIGTLLYFVLMESSATQGTLGKVACKIVVADLSGGRLSPFQAFLRFLVRPFSILTLGIGLLMTLWTRNHQCLHDLAVKSIVLRKSPSAGRPFAVTAVGLGLAGVIGIMLYTWHVQRTDLSLSADAGAPAAMPALAPVPAPAHITPAEADKEKQQEVLQKGLDYLTGRGVPVDKAEALKWFRKGAEMGEPKCQAWLGSSLMAGTDVALDVPQALKWLRKAAEQGSSMAMCYLGDASRQGNGVPKDAVEAVRWYHLAADAGDAISQYELGYAFYYGEGVAKDLPAAVEWFRKSAKQDNVDALEMLGYLYSTGEGVTRDDAQSAEHYRKAAEQGRATAQNRLAVCYQNGIGVAKDPVLAAQWYAKAADQGFADAQNFLGVCHASGTGVPENHTLAAQWYARAAEQGHAAAQYNLGSSYEHGWGVPQDNVDAMKWYLIASAQGYQTAAGKIKSLSPSLTAEQRARAEVRAEAFQKSVKK